ncbi:unnamed protein product [Chrysoparadoxa australica]
MSTAECELGVEEAALSEKLGQEGMDAAEKLGQVSLEPQADDASEETKTRPTTPTPEGTSDAAAAAAAAAIPPPQPPAKKAVIVPPLSHEDSSRISIRKSQTYEILTQQFVEGESTALLKRFTPEIRFMEREKYMPCSVDYYMKNSKLYRRPKGSKKSFKEVTPPPGSIDWNVNTIVKHTEKDSDEFEFQLEAGHDIDNGQDVSTTQIPIYGWAKFLHDDMVAPELYELVGRIVELKYIVLFPYKGSSNLFSGLENPERGCSMEHITVRVDADAGEVLEVFFAAHKHEGKWVPSRAFYDKMHAACPYRCGPPASERTFLTLKTGHNSDGATTHPVVFCAKDSHALYPKAKSWSRRTVHRALPGVADDHALGTGVTWTPNVVQLMPSGQTPHFMRYRGLMGKLPAIVMQRLWQERGENPVEVIRRPKYQSLIDKEPLPSPRSLGLSPMAIGVGAFMSKSNHGMNKSSHGISKSNHGKSPKGGEESTKS